MIFSFLILFFNVKHITFPLIDLAVIVNFSVYSAYVKNFRQVKSQYIIISYLYESDFLIPNESFLLTSLTSFQCDSQYNLFACLCYVYSAFIVSNLLSIKKLKKVKKYSVRKAHVYLFFNRVIKVTTMSKALTT